MRPWIYCLFKGVNVALSEKKKKWNFIQPSTRMCVKRAFGILKGIWRMIMKQSNVHLKNMSDIVATCIILSNLCFMNNEMIEDE